MMKHSLSRLLCRVRHVFVFWQNCARLLVIAPVRLYQLLISPMFPPSCRFTPTCSTYAIEAVSTHGIFKGLALATWRLLRCNPWSEGGYDPVPPVRTSLKGNALHQHRGSHASQCILHPTQESLTHHGR